MIKTLSIVLSVMILLNGCDNLGRNSPRGFSLPDGNHADGRKVFIELNCLACHTLKGVEVQEIEKNPDISVALGGEVTRIKTYAELLTSIINPSHRIAKGYKPEVVQEENEKSKMRNYNDVMTVTQLTDLVTFLQPHYRLKSNRGTEYSDYYRE